VLKYAHCFFYPHPSNLDASGIHTNEIMEVKSK